MAAPWENPAPAGRRCRVRCLSRLPVRVVKLWIVPGLLLLVSLAVPATRELHLLLLRMYTHVPGRETCVHGQPLGCVLYIVPTVEFTRDAGDRLLKESGRSIESFLLAHAVNPYRLSVPPADHHAGHPLQSWLALRASHFAHWGAMSSRHRVATQPASDDNTHPVISLDETLRTTRLAQAAQSDNGLLCVAEALICLDLGRERDADVALRSASSKSIWTDQAPIAFRSVRDLLMKHGLPEFDASVFAQTAASDGSYHVPSLMTREVVERMAPTVKEHDDERLADMTNRLILLLEGAAPHVGVCGNPFVTNSEMVAAMASRMGRTMPDTGVPYQIRMLAEEEIPYRYLAQYVDVDKAWRLRALVALGNSVLRDRYQPTRETRQHWFNQALWSGEVSGLAIMIFGLCLCATLAEMPFVWAGEVDPRRLMPKSRAFWLAVVPVFALMVGLLFNAANLVCQPVGLRSIEYAPSLTPLQDNLVAAAGICLAVLLARLVLLRCVLVYRISLCVLWSMWMVSVAWAAWLREDVISDLSKLYGV